MRYRRSDYVSRKFTNSRQMGLAAVEAIRSGLQTFDSGKERSPTDQTLSVLSVMTLQCPQTKPVTLVRRRGTLPFGAPDFRKNIALFEGSHPSPPPPSPSRKDWRNCMDWGSPTKENGTCLSTTSLAKRCKVQINVAISQYNILFCKNNGTCIGKND